MGTKSFTMTAPIAAVPPAPSPHRARAAIKEPTSGAVAHQAVAMASKAEVDSTIGLRPMVSESGANMGMNAVEVMRKEVDSQEAEFEA